MNRYITYESINKKRKCYYIGYTTKELEIRKKEHKKCCFQRKLPYKFYNFIREYGWDSFQWKIISHYDTETEMIQGEINNIKMYKEKHPDWECLNSTDGGEGLLNPSKEITEKKIKSLKFFYSTPEGEKLKIKIGESIKGENHWNVSGKNNPIWNKPRPKDVKEKISKTRRERGVAKGNRNPMFGIKGPNHPRARAVVLISPEGQEFHLSYYQDFCKEHNLDSGSICHVLKKRLPYYKGWIGYYKEKK